jgi:hypothetical protein
MHGNYKMHPTGVWKDFLTLSAPTEAGLGMLTVIVNLFQLAIA